MEKLERDLHLKKISDDPDEYYASHKPQINEKSRAIVQKKSGETDVVRRQEMWYAKKQESVKNAQISKQEAQERECSFRPSTNASRSRSPMISGLARRGGSVRSDIQSARLPNKINPARAREFNERIQRDEDKKNEKMDKLRNHVRRNETYTPRINNNKRSTSS
jgi:hypothetical protein